MAQHLGPVYANPVKCIVRKDISRKCPKSSARHRIEEAYMLFLQIHLSDNLIQSNCVENIPRELLSEEVIHPSETD